MKNFKRSGKTNTQRQVGKKKLKVVNVSLVRQPSSFQYKDVPAAKQATFQQSGLNILVEHTEMIGNLASTSVNFEMLGASASFPGYDLNPGNSILFPWLSTVAGSFEKYQFEKVSFELQAKNPSTAGGSSYMGFDYDWNDPVATNVTQLMINRGAKSGSVWGSYSIDIDVNRLNMDVPYRYVVDVTRTADAGRLVYGGYLMVATSGNASVTFDLFVKYRVRLILPALHSSATAVDAVFPAAQTLVAGVRTGLSELPTLPGLLSVISGTGVTPPFGGALSFPAGTKGFAISGGHLGNLVINPFPATAGVPPSAYGSDTIGDYAVYDSAGALLNQTVSTIAAGSNSVTGQGPAIPAQWSTNGQTGQLSLNLSLSLLKQAIPAAAYIVPYLYSIAGRVLSTSSFVRGKYEL